MTTETKITTDLGRDPEIAWREYAITSVIEYVKDDIEIRRFSWWLRIHSPEPSPWYHQDGWDSYSFD